jgi:hypothetical protein
MEVTDMSLGTFTWRGMEIEADMIANDIVGESIWLNRIDTGSAVPFGIIRGGCLHPMTFLPKDNLAVIQLRSAFDAFRASLKEAAA